MQHHGSIWGHPSFPLAWKHMHTHTPKHLGWKCNEFKLISISNHMLGSFCVSASIHSQMRLNTQPWTAGHKHTQTHTHLPLSSSPNAIVTALWVKSAGLVCIHFCPSVLAFVFSSVSPSFVQSLSVMMNQGEAVIGTALWLGYCCQLPPSILCPPSLDPLPSSRPSLLPSILSNSCLKPLQRERQELAWKRCGARASTKAFVCLCVFWQMIWACVPNLEVEESLQTKTNLILTTILWQTWSVKQELGKQERGEKTHSKDTSLFDKKTHIYLCCT